MLIRCRYYADKFSPGHTITPKIASGLMRIEAAREKVAWT